jgi:tetratricopeptide (TPR) repeat protein
MRRWFHQLTDMYKKIGDLDSARRTLREEMAFDPASRSRWEGIADTYFEGPDWDERRVVDWRGYCDALYEGIRTDPRHASDLWTTWCSKGDKMYDRQYFDIAVSILEYGLELATGGDDGTGRRDVVVCNDADRARFELALGQTYCAMGRWQAAIAPLEVYVARLPPDAPRWKITPLADAYASSGRYDDALALYERWLPGHGAAADEDDKGAFPYDKRAGIELERGRPEKALGLLKKAVQRAEAGRARHVAAMTWHAPWAGSVSALHAELGLVHLRAGRKSRARDCFEKALPLFLEAAGSERSEDRREWVHRSEGRTLRAVGRAYEMLDAAEGESDWREQALEKYKKAVWVFEMAVWRNDDGFEEAELADARRDLERVEGGGGWVYAGLEADREERRKARIWSYRSNWGVRVDDAEKGIIKYR